MLPDHAAGGVPDWAGLKQVRGLVGQEAAASAIGQEADVLAFWLLRHRRPALAGDGAQLLLAQFAHGEQNMGQLGLVQPVQEVGLVLLTVHSPEQLVFAFAVTHACVVSRGYGRCSQH